MITIKKLNEKDFERNLFDPHCLDLFSFLPEPTYEQKPEYIGLSQEVIFQMHKDIDITVYEMENQHYAEIRLDESTLGIIFSPSGICIEALMFDDLEETEGIHVFHSEKIYLN